MPRPRTALVDPAVLQLRTQARAAGYNPDLPHQMQALATVSGQHVVHLRAVLTGRRPLDHATTVRLRRALHLERVLHHGDFDTDPRATALAHSGPYQPGALLGLAQARITAKIFGPTAGPNDRNVCPECRRGYRGDTCPWCSR